MKWYLTDFDVIRSEKSLTLNKIDISICTELSDDQVDYFVNGNVPDGKQRKSGTLDLEDIPSKSNDELFTEEMESLNEDYDDNMTILANKYNIAVARDGSSETAKVESARAEITTLDEQYELDQTTIITKYYGA